MTSGRGFKKVEDIDLIKAYSKLKSVWRVAEKFGMCGQSIHERLIKLGKIEKLNVFSEKEFEILRKEYLKYRDSGKLSELAKKLGRTKQFICRQARKIGLTDKKREKPFLVKPGSNPYGRLHARVRSIRGCPHKCEICGDDSKTKQYDWANLTGKYEDPNDYKRMCKKCHREYDKKRLMLAHKRHEI